jgi:cell division protein FtsB
MEEIKKHLEYEYNRADNAWWESLTRFDSKKEELKKLETEIKFLEEDVKKYEDEKNYFNKLLTELNENEENK